MEHLNLAILAIALVGNVFLALFTYFKNPRSATNQLFFLFILAIVLYLLFNSLLVYQTTPEKTFFWVKMVISVAVAINLFFYFFAKAFPQQKFEVNRFIFWSAVISTALLIIAAQINLIFVSAPTVAEGGGVPGVGMPFFLLHTILFLGGSFITFVKKFRKSTGVQKLQLKLFMFGAVFMFLAILITNVLFVILFNNASLVGLLPIYTLIFVSFISYAIVKHRFLGIGLIVARTVSYTLLVGLFGVLYALLFAVISSLFIASSMSFRTIAISTILALFMAFSFQTLRRFLERISDRIFYKDHYDTNSLLYDLTRIMASTLRLGDLTHQILKDLLVQMRVSKGAFVLVENNHIFEVAQEGYQTPLEIEEQKTISLISKNQILVFEELPEGETKDILRNLEISVVTSLRTGGKDIGLLILGDKLSGDIYTAEDLKILEIISSEAAVAIQNAKAYEEIKRFNITLQQEVDQATHELKDANTRLLELDKLKDDFVSIASHELRTPMTAIKSYLWMALNKGDMKLSEKMNKYLNRAYVSTERLINLVNDMLNVSRIESGRIEIRPSVIDIQMLISDITAEVAPKAGERGITIEMRKDASLKVFADLDKVHQVLLNLVGNALKFTPAGGSVNLSCFADGKMVEVAVKDNGIGIPKDDLSSLFKKFGRLDNSYVAAATVGGTGLGLYICKSLVELMGGKIWADSEGLGKGAVFTFSLPLATPEVMKNAQQYTVTPPVGEAKILESASI